MVGIWKFNRGEEKDLMNYLDQRFQSGHNYFPSTVSEMVHDPTSPEGKIFFAFCMVGGVLILLSEYTYKLRNVWIGDDARLPYFNIPFIVFRYIMPPLGMMIVCGVTVTLGVRDFPEKIGATIHTLGAVMAIGGYILFEIHALWISKIVILNDRERFLRRVIIILCAIFALTFEVCGVIIGRQQACAFESLAQTPRPCPLYDHWVVPSQKDLDYLESHKRWGALAAAEQAKTDGTSMLYDTASGWVLVTKMINFSGETLAGIFMLVSHVTIWYYADERQFDCPDDMYGAQYQQMLE
jgi:hypothetical protein